MEEEINGLYDDDGNKINPSLYPKPQLCLSCKKNCMEDEMEDILCNLTRYDQRNETEFICYAYEQMGQDQDKE